MPMPQVRARSSDAIPLPAGPVAITKHIAQTKAIACLIVINRICSSSPSFFGHDNRIRRIHAILFISTYIL